MAKKDDKTNAAADQKNTDVTPPETPTPPESPNSPAPKTPGYQVNSPVQHNGVRYDVGSVLVKITAAQAKPLLERKIITALTE
jgi:hypothetical protein